jgi:hypothetical protein
MLRPTRFRLVTDSDIVPALRSCNLIKMKSYGVQIVGIPGFAPWKAPDDWLTLGLWPRLQKHPVFFGNVAREWRGFNPGAGGVLRLALNQASFGLKSLRLRLWRLHRPRGFAAPKIWFRRLEAEAIRSAGRPTALQRLAL